MCSFEAEAVGSSPTSVVFLYLNRALSLFVPLLSFVAVWEVLDGGAEMAQALAHELQLHDLATSKCISSSLLSLRTTDASSLLATLGKPDAS
jgi:hypothetical protein